MVVSAISISHVVAAPLGRDQLLLTKGDNNHADDIGLYQGLEWLERKHIVGKVRGYSVLLSHVCGMLRELIQNIRRYLPYIGYVTTAMVRHISSLLLPQVSDINISIYSFHLHTIL